MIPFSEPKEVIIVYVHGFLGDKDTFNDFPDLLQATMKLYNVKIINKVFPAFNTNGVFQEFVEKIVNWLYQNANDKHVILMGHSMGGILIADVFRKILKGDVPFMYKLEKTPRIVGVIGFDSPYFGLSASLCNAGARKIKETITVATNYFSSFLNNNNNNANDDDDDNNNSNNNNNDNDNNNKKIDNIKTQPTKSRSIDSTNKEDTNTITNTNANKNNGSGRWGFLSNLALGTAAVAAIGSTLLNQNTREAVIKSGQQIFSESTNYLVNYGKFLEPLIEIEEQYQRINDLVSHMIATKNHFKFKDYYPITQVDYIDGTPEKATFISLPNDKQYKEYFEPIPAAKNSSDPIDSHTRMFNSSINYENVHILADNCLNDIYNIIKYI